MNEEIYTRMEAYLFDCGLDVMGALICAALTFIFLPVINYVTTGGEFGNASNYGMVLMSLIIMYCIIFNDKSSKLASTQTELNMATEIQASMLPSIFPAFPERDEFDLYASMDPAKEVGGDFYDFFMIDNDHLGGMKGARYKDYEIQFDKGDKIFVYTDGVPEATDANKELFGTDRMIDALNSNTKADPKETLRIVRASVDEFVGSAEQFDDFTMVCLEYRGL